MCLLRITMPSSGVYREPVQSEGFEGFLFVRHLDALYPEKRLLGSSECVQLWIFRRCLLAPPHHFTFPEKCWAVFRSLAFSWALSQLALKPETALMTVILTYVRGSFTFCRFVHSWYSVLDLMVTPDGVLRLKCLYYLLWKVYIVDLALLNNRLTCT